MKSSARRRKRKHVKKRGYSENESRWKRSTDKKR